MIKGIGIDIIDIKRIKSVIEKFGEKFYEKILTEKEITANLSRRSLSRILLAGLLRRKHIQKHSAREYPRNLIGKI